MKPKSGTKLKTVDPAEPKFAEPADLPEPGEVAEIKAKQKQEGKGKYGTQPSQKYVPPDEEEVELTWIEIELQDRVGNPVPGQRFVLTTSDKQEIMGTLDKDGFARIENIAKGSCKVSFPDYDKAAWEKA